MSPAYQRSAILIMEEDAATRTELHEVLSEAGYCCRSCSDLVTAAQSVRVAPPELILSAARIAGVEGLAACQMLQEQGSLPSMPLMFLSGTQGPGVIRRVHDGAGIYYLRKPLDAAVLLELVDRSLSKAPLVAEGQIA